MIAPRLLLYLPAKKISVVLSACLLLTARTSWNVNSNTTHTNFTKGDTSLNKCFTCLTDYDCLRNHYCIKVDLLHSKCVECYENSHCPNSHCEETTNLCAPVIISKCQISSQCIDPAVSSCNIPHHNTFMLGDKTTKKCRTCQSNNDCKHISSMPMCSKTLGCVHCLSSLDCGQLKCI
jgi:hypothetical protein